VGRYGVENDFGMLVYIWLNAAFSAVFALSRPGSLDREYVLDTTRKHTVLAGAGFAFACAVPI
jgi:hypothetical protein